MPRRAGLQKQDKHPASLEMHQEAAVVAPGEAALALAAAEGVVARC